MTFKIGKHAIGADHPPFIIAEMSGNHNQSLDRALAIVDAAADAGVAALKLQTYSADTMTIDVRDREFVIEDAESLWKGENLYALYAKAHTPWEWHKPIFDRCRERGILCFSSPFDETAVDFLEKLDVPCYKIASFEIVDLPLIRRAAATGKPMIISTGMATVAEIDDAVRAARGAGAKDIVLLKCTSSYPAPPDATHLRTIPHLRELFGTEVGLSDHTFGIGASVASVALGATVIEKHFTLRRADGGVDSEFSLEPAELKSLCDESLRAWQALGSIRYGTKDAEKASSKHRRSIYVVRDVAAGEVFTKENLRNIRPGLGLPPKYFETFLGKKANRAIKRGTPLGWEHLG